VLTAAAQGTGRRAGAGPPGAGAGGLRLTSSAHRLYNMIQVRTPVVDSAPAMSIMYQSSQLHKFGPDLHDLVQEEERSKE
jgi:hypothetical protein